MQTSKCVTANLSGDFKGNANMPYSSIIYYAICLTIYMQKGGSIQTNLNLTIWVAHDYRPKFEFKRSTSGKRAGLGNKGPKVNL